MELSARHGIVVASAGGFGASLVTALTGQGGVVTRVEPSIDLDSLGVAFRTAASHAGEDVPFVVVAHLDAAASRVRSLVDLEEGDWAAACERSIEAALTAVQAAHQVMGPGGRLIVVVPSISAIGAAGLVPLCAAVEAQRMLAKSAARRWATQGITVNVVTVDAGAFFPALAGATPTLNPALLGSRDAVADVVAALAYLVAPAASGVTGATLGLDGGTVLAP